MSQEKYKACIDACYGCAIACEHCLSEDLNESEMEKMKDCIELDRECASFCRAAAHVMSIDGKYAKDLCALCAVACDACAKECEKHAQMEHCKECARECRKCAEECRKLAA